MCHVGGSTALPICFSNRTQYQAFPAATAKSSAKGRATSLGGSSSAGKPTVRSHAEDHATRPPTLQNENTNKVFGICSEVLAQLEDHQDALKRLTSLSTGIERITHVVRMSLSRRSSNSINSRVSLGQARGSCALLILLVHNQNSSGLWINNDPIPKITKDHPRIYYH